jgi:hypothetical protein
LLPQAALAKNDPPGRCRPLCAPNASAVATAEYFNDVFVYDAQASPGR